jgi:hypothetical protein
MRVQCALTSEPESRTVKTAELNRLKGLKASGEYKQAVTPGRFGKDHAAASNRREQRKLDQAQGLVPFAVKLDGDLVKQLHALAQERGTGLSEVVAELLKKSLAG